MPNPATVPDVEFRWRPLSADESAVAATLLDDAWSILQVRLPTLAARLAADPIEVDDNLVRMTLANMVIRVLRNVDGKTQESIEDYSYSINQSVAAGYLYVSDDELSVLTPTATSSAAFTINPYFATASSDMWIDT